MKAAIVPKSDQLNADDLIGGPMTIRIRDVAIRGGQEQPVSIYFDDDKNKPYKPCKSMCRVLVAAWGPDAKEYVGKSITVYRDDSVTWAGMAVGGIRISHMTDIPDKMVMALTATKGKRKPYVVQPLVLKELPEETAHKTLTEAAGRGTDALRAAWESLSTPMKKHWQAAMPALKEKAAQVTATNATNE